MAQNIILHHYNDDHNTTSASIVVPYLLEYIEVERVIDIGCGLGQWLQVFQASGATEAVGIDGAHVPRELRKIQQFHEFDLTDLPGLKKFLKTSFPEKFNLCLSLEVAEHLPEGLAREFIALLASLSDCVLFSAAIPNQTGENHINEQPHEYWVGLFAENGYTCCDIFRKKFWNNASINWWYRQNMFLFINENCLLKKAIANQYDGNTYIHPELLKLYIPAAVPQAQPISLQKQLLFKLKKLLCI
jgi:SAM-dependent methyltransferase